MLDRPLNTLSAGDRRIRELAHTMFELNARGECTEALLLAEGFSRHELETFGPAAKTLANHRFVRRVDIDHTVPTPLAERMAAVIVAKVGAEKSAVAALQAAGFTGPEIAEGIDEANRLAGKRLVKDKLASAQLITLAYTLGGMITAAKLPAGA